MKVVVSKSWSGFKIPFAMGNKYCRMTDREIRTDEILINYVEESQRIGTPTGLTVDEFPDNASDWFIDEYDGMEWVVFTLDGIIYKTSEKGWYPAHD